MAGIRVAQVKKRFGDTEALKAVSLEVRDQEFTVLLGPSGCGKTTLLRIIAGLERESAGEVFIGDRRVNGVAPRARGIAMVFQNYAVFPHMTVFENIAFGLRMQRLANEVVRPRVERAAAMMHIEHLLDRYSGQLSGGQRQRVAVSRALAVEPDVLLMDEPLSNLDALLRLEMRAELKGLLQESRTTTIYVTHDQVEAMSLADRIAVMWQGEIVQYDRPLTVYQQPATTFVGGFIGSPPMNVIELAVEDAAGGRIGRVGRGRLALPPDLPLPDGGKGRIQLGVRPEDLAAVPAGEHGDEIGLLPARVQVVEPLGPHVQATLRLADAQSAAGEPLAVRLTAPPDSDLQPGASVMLRPHPERLCWFDPATGRALA